MRFRRRTYRMPNGGFFGGGGGANRGMLVIRRAGGKRKESSGGQAGENECLHSLVRLLGDSCSGGFLFFGGPRLGRIDDSRVLFHLLFLLCRRINDRRILFDDWWRNIYAGVAGDEDEC